MTRKPERRQNQHTHPDHRPELPILRGPQDPIDAAVREMRTRFDPGTCRDALNGR